MSRCERVRANKQRAARPFRLPERRHGLAEMVERRTVVHVKHPPVNSPHLECEFIVRSPKNSRRAMGIVLRNSDLACLTATTTAYDYS